MDVNDINQLLNHAELLQQSRDGEEKDGRNKKEKKKNSFFSKLLQLLTEEEEEETAGTEIPEVSETGITEENKEILEELSKEDGKKKKKDRKKKKKDKNVPDEEDEESEEETGKNGKKKKKKAKKEKPAKEEKTAAFEKPAKKLPKKRVISIFALCFSILAFILIMLSVVPGITNVKQARWAFDNADYETCYTNLYGVERNEEEEQLYRKSAVILSVERHLDSYYNLTELNMKVEALDALLEGVRTYRSVEQEAAELGVSSRIEPVYGEICKNLETYQLTAEDIDEILAYESKVAYTLRLESIVNGTPFEWEGLGEVQTDDSNN